MLRFAIFAKVKRSELLLGWARGHGILAEDGSGEEFEMPSTDELNYRAPVTGTVDADSPHIESHRLIQRIRPVEVECARRAIREQGFLSIRLQRTENDVLLILQQSMQKFFAASDEQKQPFRDIGGNHGWTPSFEEPAYQPGTISNLESFDVKSALMAAADDPHWPDQPGFQAQVRKGWSLYADLSGRMLELIARAVEVPAAFFKEACNSRELNTLRLLHYPPDTAVLDASDVGIAAHTDFECITFLYQSAPGLEVRNPEGNWLNVPADSGTLIVLFGDMLERWTNGKVQATGHRVRRSQQQRFSIVMFVAANPGLMVAPLPKFVDPGNPPRFEPVEQTSHIAQEVARAKSQMA